VNPADARILTINGGSSSIKFAVFDGGEPPRRLAGGAVERIGLRGATLHVKGVSPGESFVRPVTAPDQTTAVGALMDWLGQRKGTDAVTAVGHRVVHGGPKYFQPQRITTELVAELHRLSAFDPEHLPEEISLVEEFHQRFRVMRTDEERMIAQSVRMVLDRDESGREGT
jgi:acetate kinase